MSNSIRSPEVITSIIFGVFASALGVIHVILFLVYRKNRKGDVEVGESRLADARLRLAHKPAESTKPYDPSSRQSLYTCISCVLIVAVLIEHRYASIEGRWYKRILIPSLVPSGTEQDVTRILARHKNPMLSRR